ncbi:MAG: CHAD domain-containing protein [Ilumatobacteraceae bacterium]
MAAAPQTTTLVHRSSTVADVANALVDLGFEIGLPSIGRYTVLDSFDGRLHATGITVLHISAIGQAPMLLVLQPGSVPATLVVRRIPEFADDLPAGPLRRRLIEPLEMRAMMPLFAFDDTTIAGALRDSRGSVIATAIVHSLAEAGSTPVVEIVSAPGHEDRADEVVAALIDVGGKTSRRTLIDSIARARSFDRRGYDSSPAVDLDHDVAAVDGFRMVFTNLVATISANLGGTIDDIDTEFLHEFRVAIRRTRSVLGLGNNVVASSARQYYRTEFAWLAGVTGPLRDLDVYILEWNGTVGHLAADRLLHLRPVLLHLQQHRKAALEAMIADLKSERASRLLREWTAISSDLEPGPDAERPLREIVATQIAKAYDTVIGNGRQITAGSPAEALHDLRKDAKKLRYAVECFGGLLPNQGRKAFVRQLKDLQDNLGRHQDAEVHSAELQVVAHELSDEHATPPTLLALGQLIEHLELEKVSARAEFADRFASFDSKATHRIVTELLESLES